MQRDTDSEPATCAKCGWQLDSRGDCNYCPGGPTFKSDSSTPSGEINRGGRTWGQHLVCTDQGCGSCYRCLLAASNREVAALRAEVERQKRINANAERSRQAAIDCQIEAEKASDALRVERDALRSDFERVNRHWTDAEAEVERMRPVVEAAHDWAYGPDHHPECDPRSDCPACCALGEAARIAHAATGEDARPHVD